MLSIATPEEIAGTEAIRLKFSNEYVLPTKV
jgi:hypothetical protein